MATAFNLFCIGDSTELGVETIDEALAKAQALTNDAMEAAGYR